ncbi:MAG TPA: nuclear transport factor 2 family protein [Gaiellaceae bacterium]|nr:nuclear transport factor 2 family protein [Gaiellaceae bacterium]
MSLLSEYVERFNTGVRNGDWSSMLELVARDAELEFIGIPVGPFAGRDAIGEAYRAQPPDDELVLLDRIDDTSAVYAWAGEPARPAGELHLEERDGSVVRIRVQYEQFS